MPNFKPEPVPLKIKVIPYEFIVSESIRMFFDNHQDMLMKENGQYIFLNNINPKAMENILLSYLTTIINDRFSHNIFGLDTVYIIVDECFPHMNWRRSYHTDLLSDKSNKFIQQDMLLKYILVERDIKIDELALNIAFENQFDRFFRASNEVMTTLCRNNIMFFRNIYMPYRDVYQTIQHVFGKHNTTQQFHTKRSIKDVMNTNGLIYNHEAFKKIKIPTELELTCQQVIDLLFANFFERLTHG